jgi:hypothetical protein
MDLIFFCFPPFFLSNHCSQTDLECQDKYDYKRKPLVFNRQSLLTAVQLAMETIPYEHGFEQIDYKFPVAPSFLTEANTHKPT